MVTREEIVAEINKLPEEHLEELYKVIRDFGAKCGREEKSDESVMAKLRRIRISSSPDFSTRAGLYDLEELNGR